MHSAQGSHRWEWDRTVSILTNPLVLGSIAKAFGIAMLIFWLILEIISWTMGKSMTLYVLRHPGKTLEEGAIAFGFVGVLIVVTMIATAIVFRNGYDAHFGVNEDGAWMTPQQRQRETNQSIHKILFGMGVLMGKPGTAGTAILAETGQDRSISWNEVKRIEPYPFRLAIGLHDSWHCALIIYCLPENYEAVLQFANSKKRNP